MPPYPGEVPERGDLPPSELERAGGEALRWIRRYLEAPGQYAVLSPVAPGAVRRALPAEPPTRGERLDRILADFESLIVPGITHWNHPGFLAYFATSGSVPGIIGELLTAALNVNGMLWATSPAATELEQLSLDWLRRMLGLDGPWFGIINDTASVSTLVALAAARESHAELEVRRRGMAGRPDLPALRIYASTEAHSSVDKAAITLGIGQENVVRLASDDEFRLRPEALARAIADDRARGMLPLAVVATTGTTSTTSIDPVRPIAEICRRERAWLHVDGAYGGVAAIVPELRHVLDGVELADSLVVNPHKWLFTPIDCSVLYTRRADILERAFTLIPEYLVTPRDGETVDLMNYGVQLGRRFRSLKLWMVIRAFGVDGLIARIRDHVALARELAGWIDATPSWERLAPVPLSVVCFRWAPPDTDESTRDALNARLLHHVNATGRFYLSHTKLRGRYALRVAIANLATERKHLSELWGLLESLVRR